MPPSLSFPAAARPLPVALPALLLFIAWLSGLLQATGEAAREADTADEPALPNILLIIADDLGYNDTSAMGPTGLHTPHLADMAAAGVTFTRHYADATCTPSRVAMLTGRYAERSGFRPVGAEIPADYLTIAERLQAAGYRTHLTGKWHAGEVRLSGRPLAKGFDSWFGFLNQFELGAVDASGKSRPTYRDPRLRRDHGEPSPESGHLTDLLAEDSLARIDAFRRGDRPWFLVHAFLAPHAPIEPAPRYAERFPATPAGAYEALVSHMDDVVGRLLAAVDPATTLVVFVSDNGGTNLQRDNNFPFHGRKNEVYEGAYRTPLILQWTDRLPGGVQVSDIVMNVDLHPTLLSAAGLGATAGPQLDGIDLLPLLLTGAGAPPRPRGWESYATNVASLNYSFLSADGLWRQASPEGLSRPLFDLLQTPSGERDVAAAHPDRAAALEAQFWETHWAKSVLPVTAGPGKTAQQRLYSGFDTLRSPFRHGFAIGLELGPLEPGPQLLAGQPGLWELRYTEAGELEWSLGDTLLRDGHFDPGRCNRVVLTGYLQPPAALDIRPPRSPLRLYSDGMLRDLADDVSATLPAADTPLAAPTFVNAGGTALFVNMLLGAFTDPYSPRVAGAFAPYYEAGHADATLAMPTVDALDDLLCQPR